MTFPMETLTTVEPTDAVKEVLKQLNTLCPTIIAGGSLLRADSKDVDCIMFANGLDKGTFMCDLLKVPCMRDSTIGVLKFALDSPHFPWAGLCVKVFYKGQNLEITINDVQETPSECISQFPLCIQQVGYTPTGLILGESFCHTALMLSPKRKQKSLFGVTWVCEKYAEYYPDLPRGASFSTALLTA